MPATVDFIESGFPACPMIRIFSDSVDDFKQLRAWVIGVENVGLSPLDICRGKSFWKCLVTSLLLVKGEADCGISEASQGCFLWSLTPESWNEVACQIQPFTEATTDDAPYHFQWLAGPEALGSLADSQISLLISTSETGMW